MHQQGRSITSGVDELILAAKIEESASAAAALCQQPGLASVASIASLFHNYPHLSSYQPANPNATCPPMSQQSQTLQQQEPTYAPPPYVHAPYVPYGRGLGYPPAVAQQQQQPQQQAEQQIPIPIFHQIALQGYRDLTSHAPVPTPRNKSELELYTLLERANLLEYFGTFVKFGGDDVQQLSDADENEFIEIMKLIGMTSKPLHIRRFQRALNEWREYQRNCDHLDDSVFGFRRPYSYREHSSFGSPSVNMDSSNASSQFAADFDRYRARSSALMACSPAPTPTNSEFSLSQRSVIVSETPQNQQHQQYSTPHVEIINAPKRPRLMDSIKPRDLTKTVYSEIATPDEHQLNVRQAIIDNRKRAKMGLEPRRPPSAINKSHDDNNHDGKRTANNSSMPNMEPTDSSESDDDPAENIRRHRRKALSKPQHHDQEPVPVRKSKVRTSLMERFNNSATDKELPSPPELQQQQSSQNRSPSVSKPQ